MIGMLVVNGGSVHDYFGYDKMKKPGLPFITIPTTAGTGSEVTIWAVITDTRRDVHIKEGFIEILTNAYHNKFITIHLQTRLGHSRG